MKIIISRFIFLSILPLSLISCGGDSGSSETLSITGTSTVSSEACSPLTINLETPASEDLFVQPSIQAGSGAVYSDSDCSRLAFFSSEIAADSSSATIYYSGLGFAQGAVTIKVEILRKSDLEVIDEAIFNLNVN